MKTDILSFKNHIFLIASHEHETSFVGLEDFAQNIKCFSRRKGFRFTVLVCGESGLGKSTAISSPG